MTTALPDPPASPPTPEPTNPPSDLMTLVLAYKDGVTDWPTTKAALIAFPYVSGPRPPTIGDPDYADWYNSDPPIAPNSYKELSGAAYAGHLEWDRFMEVNDAMLSVATKAKR